MSNFAGKTVIVTGGSRGIGKAIVQEFSKQGAKVFFTYRKSAEKAVELATSCGAKAVCCLQDDMDTIEKTVASIVKEEGAIDILINNAGITRDMFLMMMSYDEWSNVLDTNINGAWRWVKAVTRPMLNHRSGVIINIASVAGLIGIGGQTSYATSKGALLAFTRALAAEMGPKGIRVNSVVPGFIETDMTAKMPRQIKRSNIDRILLKRFGTGKEISGVVAFLASDAASYIMGQQIVVDGGLTATVAI